MDLKRYQNKFRHKQRSVAEHSWFVTKIVHGLALWGRDKFKTGDVDIERVMFLALNHDIAEAYTGDVMTTTKNYSELLHTEIEKLEKTVYDEIIIKTLPKSWGSCYKRVPIELSERVTIESKLVKAGDLLDRVFECMEEIVLGNLSPFESILMDDLQRLYDLKLLSVNYFMKYALVDIGADVYIPEKIRKELDQLDFTKYF